MINNIVTKLADELFIKHESSNDTLITALLYRRCASSHKVNYFQNETGIIEKHDAFKLLLEKTKRDEFVQITGLVLLHAALPVRK